MTRIATLWWHEEDGVLSFEWAVLLTLLCIGIVSGLAAARDAVIDELGDVAQAMQALDGTYEIDLPLAFTFIYPPAVDGDPDVVVDIGGASDSGFLDSFFYTDCSRVTGPVGQLPRPVSDIES
ncbi:hypothetical protein ETAA8_61790 [Anatilimnocola aggregata]|uniref:Uncharacterized protein n=1 Tax=Anatilimnocola aggregata TaxID=2528021 RepID=A0A517YLC1_9BACT|nr:hypothetical protein [Anatilimnocola aggregata]QDU31026.1 hypothetical protein ETAA8_61790 [Anatilimnocola aggregata]